MVKLSIFNFLTLIFLVTFCASAEQRQAPSNLAKYALITDSYTGSLWQSMSPQYVSVDRIDRIEVPIIRDAIPTEIAQELSVTEGLELDNPIILAPGMRRLLVSACRTKPSLLKLMWEWDLNFLCARTVILFDAEPNARYGLEGDVNVDEDYADVWIVDLINRGLVVDKIRLQGLKAR